MKRISFLICTLIATLAISQRTNADITINMVESGGNIVATMFGSIDLNATQGFIAQSTGYNGFLDTLGAVSFTDQNSDYYGVNFSSWTPFGTGGIFDVWSSSSGDALHLFSDPVIGVPVGYISGDSLSATATYNGSSFAALGWTPGSHVSVLTNGNFRDTVTVNVGVVPEPTSCSLLGLLGLAVVTRRRKR